MSKQTQQPKEVKKPQPFEYLGKTFTPIVTNEKYNWNKLARKLWGGDETLKPLSCINDNGYSHEEFYKVAKANGCGKVDVFEMDGEKVIPCNMLMYYGKPSWYGKPQPKEVLHTQPRFHVDCEFEGERLVDDVTVIEEPKQKDKKVLVYSPRLQANILLYKKELKPIQPLHTQGEWRIIRDVLGNLFISAGVGREICRIDDNTHHSVINHDIPEEEMEANAQLIVKAVNNYQPLVEALGKAGDFIKRLLNCKPDEATDLLTNHGEDAEAIIETALNNTK